MSFFDTVKADLKKQPWYVWAGALAGGGVVIFILVKERLAASTAASTTAASTNTAANTASNPLSGYDMSSMAGIPYGYEDNYTPPGTNPTTPPTTPPAAPLGLQGIIRNKTTAGGAANYDKSHSGVPIHSSPGGAQTSTAAYGSTVQISGQAVQGPSDFGVTAWYPVTVNGAAGFINAFDFANIAQAATGGGGSIYANIGLEPEQVGWM